MSDFIKRVATRGADGIVRVGTGRAAADIPQVGFTPWSGSQQQQNQPPTVTLTAPKASDSLKAGASVALTASASDSDGTVATVRYYSGATLIGQSSAGGNFPATWTPATAGSYTLTAVAEDNAGSTTTSAAVTVTVSANQLPTVSITSPTAGSSITLGQSVSLTASASDGDGTIARVKYFNGGSQIGTSQAAPTYPATWTPPAAGTYSLTAQATDDSGGIGTSAAVSITVTQVAAAVEVNGRITDPILRFTALLRAFGATSANGNWLFNATDGADQLNETPLRSPSVFNFQRPGYIPAGGEADTARLTIPEMQITDEASVAGFMNFMNTVVSNGHGSKGLDGSASNMDVQLDLTAETNVATDAAALADQVIAKLTPNGLASADRTAIVTMLNTIPAGNANGKLRRSRAAVLAVLASQQFTVEAA